MQIWIPNAALLCCCCCAQVMSNDLSRGLFPARDVKLLIIFSLKIKFLLTFFVKFNFQALFQSAQHLYKKGKDPDPEPDLEPNPNPYL
jgi:hypothetical protein